MRLLCCEAAAGGVGRSSLLAQLGMILHQRGRSVALLDAHPGNALGLYLGMDPVVQDGWYRQMAGGGKPLAASMQTAAGLPFLPFGRMDVATLVERQDQAEADLGAVLTAMQQVFDGWLLVDAPPAGHALGPLLRDRADACLHVIRADPLCLQAEPLPSEDDAAAHAWVINLFEPVQSLQSDIYRVWRQLLGEALLPEVIHRDPALPQALAAGEDLRGLAPNSRLVHDLQGLAQRLEQWWQTI